jgi:hypothetical protein
MVQIKMLSSGKETKGEEEKCARHGEKSGTRAEKKRSVLHGGSENVSG